MSAAQMLARVRALEAARAAAAARAALATYSVVEMASRASWLFGNADPLSPPTPNNRRACRLFALLNVAHERRDAHLRELAQDTHDES